MGEGKIRRRLAQRLLDEHKFCCFCGGATPATTIDHVPARIVFWGKRRPEGLELPACKACNEGTRKLDQAAGLFARFRVADEPLRQQVEFNQLAIQVSRNFPGWEREMNPSAAQWRDFRRRFGRVDGVPGNVGPLADDAAYTLGAKLGFALHYKTSGEIVPPDGLVSVVYETTASEPEGGMLPSEISNLLGPEVVLKQGEWTTDGHFSYRSFVAEGGGLGVYHAHIGRSFQTVSVVFCDGRHPPVNRPVRTFSPGDLQRADQIAISRYATPRRGLSR
jgi:hypothetical protein